VHYGVDIKSSIKKIMKHNSAMLLCHTMAAVQGGSKVRLPHHHSVSFTVVSISHIGFYRCRYSLTITRRTRSRKFFQKWKHRCRFHTRMLVSSGLFGYICCLMIISPASCKNITWSCHTTKYCCTSLSNSIKFQSD